MPQYLERTLIILKPDAVERALVGTILSRFEAKGLKILSMRMEKLSEDVVSRHYAEHEGKCFYSELLKFMTSGPVVLLALEGLQAISVCRVMIGATKGTEAAPGTIRGDYSQFQSFNLIHGSDSMASAQRELDLFFPGLSDFKAGFISSPRRCDLWCFGPEPLYDESVETETERLERVLNVAKIFQNPSEPTKSKEN